MLGRDAPTHQEEEGAEELDIARQDQIVGVGEGHASDGALEAHRGARAASHGLRRCPFLPPLKTKKKPVGTADRPCRSENTHQKSSVSGFLLKQIC